MNSKTANTVVFVLCLALSALFFASPEKQIIVIICIFLASFTLNNLTLSTFPIEKDLLNLLIPAIVGGSLTCVFFILQAADLNPVSGPLLSLVKSFYIILITTSVMRLIAFVSKK